MVYEKTLKFLYSQLPMFQRVGISAYRTDLTNTRLLLDEMGNPHKHFKSIHIAGTNGKGSSSHMLAAVLQEAGYRTGLYTSPHLKDFRERIKIDGKMVKKNFVVEFVKEHRKILKKIKPSFFEMTVAMAFEYFKEEEVDIAVIETGLGGRLDSTNIIQPVVSLITNIGLDHTEILGDTIKKIAIEKAGIIKRYAPVIISETNPITEKVFKEIAKTRTSTIYFADQLLKAKHILQPFDNDGKLLLSLYAGETALIKRLEMDLVGGYQIKNILGVMQTLEVLKEKGYDIKEKHIRTGISQVRKLTGLMGRWQMLSQSPLTICDVAHNVDGIKEVLKQVEIKSPMHLHFVFGMVKDKDITKVLEILPKDATYYFCKADLPRALDADELKTEAAKHKLKGKTYPSVKAALETAQNAAEEGDMVLVSGSSFVVAEVV